MDGGESRGGLASKRFRAGFARANAHDFQQFSYKNLAVADLAGAGRFLDGLDDRVDLVVGNRDLEFRFGKKIDDIFCAAIKFGVTLLTSEYLDLGHGQSLDADFRQSLASIVEFERFDDRSDQFH